METQGLVYVFTGDGKGKTSAALGVAVRAALAGGHVVWISFYKGKNWDLAEKHLADKIPNLEMHWMGKGFHIDKAEKTVHSVKIASVGKAKVIDTASENEHIKAAQDGFLLAKREMSGKPWLIVLDEVLNAIGDGLLSEKDVLQLVSSRGGTHVVLTGRGATPMIIETADLVTECRKIKHPYDSGKLAVRGLDF